MAVNVTRNGGIYIEISGDVSQLHADLIKAENMGRAAGKNISEALSGAMTAKDASRTANSLTRYMSLAARSAKATTADLSKMDDTFRAMGVSIGVTEKNLGDFISRQRQAFQTQTQKAFLDNLKGIQRLTGATNDEMNRLAKSLGGVGNEFNNAGRSARDFGSCIEGSVKKYAGMLFGVQTLKSTAAAIGEATLRADKLDKAYTTIYDSAGSAKEQLNFLYGVSNDLGLQFQSTAESAKTFFAAGKGTALEGELNNIFKSFSSAGSALSLSQDEMQGVFLALGQMISKGKVQAEELRGQLGERLPGAFDIAAKAMGVTTAELDKMLATGKITAEDLLPKMAAELEKTFGGKALAAGQGLQGQLNRFTTEWERVKASVVDSDAVAGAVGTVAEGMKSLADNAPAVAAGLKTVTVTVGAGVAAWGAYTLAMKAVGMEVLTAQTKMQGLANVAKGAAAGVKGFGKTMLNALGGPVGLAITAAAMGITYLATRQTEAEKIAANYGDTMEEVRQRLLGVEDAAQNAGTKIREMSLASANSERDNLQEKLNNIRKEFKIPLLVFENTGLNFWNYSDIISSVKDIQNAFLSGALNAKETIIQFKTLYAEAVNAGRATPEVSKLFDALEKGVVSVETINVRLDETNKLIGEMSAGFRDLSNAAALARDELKLTGLALDPAKVSKVLDEFQTKIDQAKRTAQGRAVATALMRVGVSNTDIDKSGNVNKDALALYLPEQKEAIALIQTKARQLDSLTRSASTASKAVFQISEAYERTVNASEQLRLRKEQLASEIKGDSFGASMTKAAKDYDAQLGKVNKSIDTIKANLASWQKNGKADSEVAKNAQLALENLEKQKVELAAIRSLEEERARIADRLATAQASASYNKLMGNAQGSYQAQIDSLNIELKRTDNLAKQLEIMEQIRRLEARRDLNPRELIKTGWRDQAVQAWEDYADFFQNGVPGAFASAADAFGDMVGNVLTGTESLGDAWNHLGKSLQRTLSQMASDFLSATLRMVIFGKTLQSFGGGFGLSPGSGASFSVPSWVGNFGVHHTGGFIKTLQSFGGGFGLSPGSGASFSVPSWVGKFGVHHTGGFIGENSAARSALVSAFAGAQRFHAGGVLGLKPNEVPIIGLRGEEVLTSSDPRHRDNLRPRAMSGGLSSPTINLQVNIENNTSAQVRASTTQDTAGNPVLNIQIIEQIDGALAQRVYNGRSSIGQAIDRTRGTSNARMLYRK